TGHLSDLGPVHTGYYCCDAVVNRMDHLVFARPCANRYLLLDHYSGGHDHCHCFHYREPAYSLGDTTKPLKTRNSTGKPLVYGTHGNPVVSIVCTWCIHAAQTLDWMLHGCGWLAVQMKLLNRHGPTHFCVDRIQGKLGRGAD